MTQAQKAPIAGEPVSGECCWCRVITNKKHVTSDGTLHTSALGGGAFRASIGHAPWDHELSGDLAELVDDLANHARVIVEKARKGFVDRGRKVPSAIGFSGYASLRANELRVEAPPIPRRDVVYTPQADNAAHADLVAFGTQIEANLHAVRDWLVPRLRVTLPERARSFSILCKVGNAD